MDDTTRSRPVDSTFHTVIRPRKGWYHLDLISLWRHRDLAYFLCWRDVKVRYKQTLLGILWAFLQPFMKLVVFSVVFGSRGLGVDSEGFPYPVYLYAALLPWQFFGESIERSSQSVVANEQIVSKVAFPRLLIPLASLGACLLDFVIAFSILFGLMLYYGIVPSLSVLMIIPLTLIMLAIAVGVGSFASALNVKYRDFRFTVPFIMQVWMFATPVLYPLKVLPENLYWIARCNPMAGIVEGWRSALLGKPIDWGALTISMAMACAIFAFGLLFFKRAEKRFADII